MTATTSKRRPQSAPVEAPIVPAPEPQTVFVVVDHVGQKIEGNLAGLYLTVRRPSGRPMMKEAKIEARTEEQEQAEVTARDITRPCWKIDIHPLWKDLDLNKTAIDTVLAKYSVSAPQKGEHLVSMHKLGECLVELNRLREARLALADEMAGKWESEVLTGLKAKFPQWYENQIKDRLPAPQSLRDRFEVFWSIRPLTPMDPDRIDFSALPENEARAVIDRNKEFMDQAVRRQFQSIIDEVFGELMSLCQDISDGEYEFGRRRSGAITEIMNMLDRVTNFADFANPEVLARTTAARDTLKKYNLQQINTSTTVQTAIKTAMKPLGEALRQLCETSQGRSHRNVEI